MRAPLHPDDLSERLSECAGFIVAAIVVFCWCPNFDAISGT
jgi:hypothetical protein